MQSRSLFYLICLIPAVSFAKPLEMTDLRLYSPFNPAPYQPEQGTITKTEGECLAYSSENPQERAFQCQSHDVTFKTCFARKYGPQDTLLCLNSPWDKKVTELHLTAPLPTLKEASLDMSKATPWALELNERVHCQRSKDNEKSAFQCNDGSTLSLPLYKCAPIWTISRTDLFTNRQDTTKITRAWF